MIIIWLRFITKRFICERVNPFC